MILQKDISEEKNQLKIDRVYEVLIEEKLEDENIYLGRTAYDSPEIDGIVYVHTDQALEIGSFVDVTITGALEYDLLGDF
jgi:ribosomal protein S12 methylthiotransferase